MSAPHDAAQAAYDALDAAGLPAALGRPAVIVPPVIWVEPPAVQARDLVRWTVTVQLVGVAAGDDASQVADLFDWADLVPRWLLEAGFGDVDGAPYDPGDLNAAPSTALAYAWTANKLVRP